MIIFSVERLVAIYAPFKCQQLCTTSIRKFFCCSLIISSLLIYSFNLITTGLKIHESASRCSPHKDWLIIVELISIIDVTMTMIVPFIIISIINILIALKLTNSKLMRALSINHQYGLTQRSKDRDTKRVKILYSSCQKRNTKYFDPTFWKAPAVTILSSSKEKSKNNNTIKTSHLRNDLLLKCTKNSTNDGNTILKFEKNFRMSSSINTNSISNETFRKRNKLYSRTTKVVLSISTTFLIFHCPIAICKLNSFLSYNRSNSLENGGKNYNNPANMKVMHSFLSNTTNSSIYQNLTIYSSEPDTVILDHLMER